MLLKTAQAGQQTVEILGIDRLDQVSVKAGFARATAVFILTITGNCQQSGVLQTKFLTQAAGEPSN